MPKSPQPTLRQRLLQAQEIPDPLTDLGVEAWLKPGGPTDEDWHGPYVNAILAIIVPEIDAVLAAIADLSARAARAGSTDVHAYDQVHTLIIDRLRDPLQEGLDQ
jgi:hypothetical protein